VPYVVVRRDDLVEAYRQVLGEEPPAEVVEALE